MSTALPIAARAEDDRKDSFCHFDREGLQARRVEKSCAFAYRKTNFFRRVLPYFTVQDKIPRLTLGMTGMGANILYCIHNFTFYILHSTFQKRSFDYAGIVVPAPLRMTGGRNDRGKSRPLAHKKDRRCACLFKNFIQKTGECSAAAARVPART